MPVPWVMAAPTPCSIRAKSSVARLGDRPAPVAPTMRMRLPRMYTRFWPIMSARRPMGNRRALMVRAKPITTHCTLGSSIRRPSAMEGSATITLP